MTYLINVAKETNILQEADRKEFNTPVSALGWASEASCRAMKDNLIMITFIY